MPTDRYQNDHFDDRLNSGKTEYVSPLSHYIYFIYFTLARSSHKLYRIDLSILGALARGILIILEQPGIR